MALEVLVVDDEADIRTGQGAGASRSQGDPARHARLALMMRFAALAASTLTMSRIRFCVAAS